MIGTLVVDLNGLMDASEEKDLNQPVSVLHLAKNQARILTTNS